MRAHQFQQQAGIGRVALGAAGGKGLAVARQALGRHRIKQQEIVIHQRVDHRSPRLFQRQGDPALRKAGSKSGDPGVQDFRFLFHRERFRNLGTDGLQTNFMALVGPVQAHPGHNFQVRSRCFHLDPPWRRCQRTPVRTPRSPYSRVIDMTTSECAFPVRTSRSARNSFASRRASGHDVRSGARRFLLRLFYRFGVLLSRLKHGADFIAEVPVAFGPRLRTIRARVYSCRKRAVTTWASAPEGRVRAMAPQPAAAEARPCRACFRHG